MARPKILVQQQLHLDHPLASHHTGCKQAKGSDPGTVPRWQLHQPVLDDSALPRQVFPCCQVGRLPVTTPDGSRP